ncbi:MAG TPA: tetratricopeptide repeat protein [Thermoanaerobaculia bacterium]|nr:tetratricopeptide repeat protein [Thermoanaerobaculia bacterium]
MNKDNLLFAVIGILVGFISGYLLHEVMAARQPPRLRPSDVAALAAQGALGPGGGAGAEAAPGASESTAGAPAGAPMAAIQKLKAYVEQNPNDAEAVLQLANANFDIQNWQRARDLYSHYLELRPNQPDTMVDLGVTYRELGQFDRALEIFDHAQAIAPDHWQSRFNKVIVLAFDLKKFDAAETVLAELQKLQPANPDVARLAAEVAKRRKAAA